MAISRERGQTNAYALGAKTPCYASDRDRSESSSLSISSNLHILELYNLYTNTFGYFVSAAEPRRGAPSKCRLID